MNYKELIALLEELQERGYLKFQTARTRITAIKKIFETLPDLQDENVATLDMNDIQKRFLEKYEDEVSLPTIATYISRLKSSISLVDKAGNFDKQELFLKSKIEAEMPKIEVILRQKFKVSISGLPADLSLTDVDKLSKILRAYCVD